MTRRQKKTPKPPAKKRDGQRRRNYGRLRAGTLIGVYILMAIHVTHWLITGKTLAPLELNEVMYTAELGIVTAGFIFMIAALVATAIFGRFFCGWGCHILAIEDLCAWILKKCHLSPKGIRSRVLVWVPVFVALYMFAWPQITRIYQGRPMATLHLQADAQGWASFETEHYWRNLPGPGIAILTFAVCGVMIVYVLGSRGFCTYGCPYGALFRAVDRVAPGRIRAGQDCTQCGSCTAVCKSNIRVHEELDRYGMVVNPACLRDLDCVTVCPQQSVHFGYGRPSLIKLQVSDTVVANKYDFTWWEDIIMAMVFVATLITYRGLYNLLPLLMSVALGSISAYLVIVTLRLLRLSHVKLNRWPLKKGGRLLPVGRAFSVTMLAFVIFSIHSGMVQYQAFAGGRDYVHAKIDGPQSPAASRAVQHLARASSWGLLPLNDVDHQLAELYFQREQWVKAEGILSQLVKRLPGDHMSRYRLAGCLFATDKAKKAKTLLVEALQIKPDFPQALFDLGALLIEQGETEQGIAHLRQAIKHRPEYADAHYNLGVALAMLGQRTEAMNEIERAIELNPADPQPVAFQQYLLERMPEVSSSLGEPRP